MDRRRLILLLLAFLACLALLNGQPANDLCGGSQTIVSDGTCYAGTNVNANDDIANAPGCQPNPGNQHRDVWYSFVATGNTFSYNVGGGTLGNIEILLISATGPCSGFSLMDSDCGPSALNGTFGGLVTGNTYYVSISAPSNQQGTFNICVTTFNSSAGALNCASALQICDNTPLNGNSSGYGIQELNAGNRGCLSVEHQSSWYVISIATSGTLQMTIAPTPPTDYDFAVWGPMSACPPNTSPIRCSYAAGNNNTGINSANNAPQTDLTEGAGGNRWVQDMNVTAGDVYVILIDNWSSTTTPFNLNWGGSAVISCAPLPVDLLDLKCSYERDEMLLRWSTISEINNKSYVVEHSDDGYNWKEIAEVCGAGNSSSLLMYEKRVVFEQYDNYYRLKQVDFDGNFKYYGPVYIYVSDKSNAQILNVFDLYGRSVDINYRGFVIILYDDGIYEKQYRN